MKVLVIIVSYNFERWIDRCLDSLRKSSYPVDVLVIDNCSVDNTLGIINDKYPEVRVIANRENLGFGKANDMGMHIALEEHYESVFLLNQDAWIDSTVIGELLELSELHPEYGILSPFHLTGDGKKPDPGFAVYSGIKALSDLKNVKERVRDAGFINAAFWMIPKRILTEVGGFSSLFYHYGEDKDFVNRIHFHGYKVGFATTVFGCHDREYRKPDIFQFLRSEKVYHLSEYANINYSFIKAFSFGILACIKKMSVSLFRREAKHAAGYMKITTYLLMATPSILKTRKRTKFSGPHFICS